MRAWDDLRHLEAFVRLGSAGAAGRELGVAPSTIYRRIAALEAEVGFACLVRGEGVTPAGRELAALAQSTEGSLRAIAQRAKVARSAIRGAITLTTIDGFAPLLSAPLAELAAAHPHLRVDVHISDGGLSLRRNQAEVGLALVRNPPSTLVGRKLFPVRFGVYARRGVEVTTASRWVVLGPPLEGSWLGQWEKQHAPRDRIATSTASRRFFIDLVASGLGLGLLPEPLASEHPELVEVPGWRARTAELTRTAWLLYTAEHRDDARVTTVAKVLGRHLARR